MSDKLKYRRISDRLVVDAYQYGEDLPWNKEAISKVAAFVTGVDVDDYTSIGNEHILDVVQPILAEWNSAEDKVPVEVADWPNKKLFRIELHDWILKYDTADGTIFEGVPNKDFQIDYEFVVEVNGVWHSQKDLEVEEMAKLIMDADIRLSPRGLARRIIEAGWRKTL